MLVDRVVSKIAFEALPEWKDPTAGTPCSGAEVSCRTGAQCWDGTVISDELKADRLIQLLQSLRDKNMCTDLECVFIMWHPDCLTVSCLAPPALQGGRDACGLQDEVVPIGTISQALSKAFCSTILCGVALFICNSMRGCLPCTSIIRPQARGTSHSTRLTQLCSSFQAPTPAEVG